LQYNDSINSYIFESYKLIKKKKYREAVYILEQLPDIQQGYVREVDPYFLLAVGYLLSDRFLDAQVIINKYKELFPSFKQFYFMEAFLIIKSASSSQEALFKLIDIESRVSDNVLSRLSKKISSTTDFYKFQKNIKLFDVITLNKPEKRKQQITKKIAHGKYIEKTKVIKKTSVFIIPIIVILLTIAFAYVIREKNPIAQITKNFGETFDGKKTISSKFLNEELEVNKYPVIDKVSFQKPLFFYQNEIDLIREFKSAQMMIKQQQYNSGIIIINKIINSNANIRVKDKAEFIKKFILGVEDRKSEKIDFKEIILNPELYVGVKLSVNGKISNLKKINKSIHFNLLVDYYNESFTSVVEVFSEIDNVKYSNGDVTSINGILTDVIGNEKKIVLKLCE